MSKKERIFLTEFKITIIDLRFVHALDCFSAMHEKFLAGICAYVYNNSSFVAAYNVIE